jgi:outer membrane protein assembly factor BamB
VLNPVDEPYIVSSSDPVQWLSANALARDTDGHYLVSLHLADQVLKIDRNSGELIWRLGGVSSDFAMDLVAGFQRQHNVTSLGDGRYLMFDNGLAERGYSRALELEIDLEEKTASRVWEYKLPKALYSSVTGSATRQMNGNTLMASGGTSTIVEVTRLGEVVWQAKGPLGLMYRAVPVELDAYGPVRLPRLER